MAKKKTPIQKYKNYVIILMVISLITTVLYVKSIVMQNVNLTNQLKTINNSETIKSDIKDLQISESAAIDLVLSKSEVKNIFCNNKNIRIKVAEEFENSWQVRITQDGPTDQFGLKEYRVDKNSSEVTENTYRK